MEDSVHGICPAHLPYWPSRSPFWHDYPFVFDGDGKKRSVPEVGYLLLSSYGDAGHGYAAAPVTVDGKTENLKPLLKPVSIIGHQAWQATYSVKRPGVYQFAMEPAPYFEPAEDCFIIHYTKTVIAAFGEEEGWDVPLGLKTEIVPLTRPFANYSGNLFQGRVLLDGKPVPGAVVEVEYYNRDDAYTIPNVYFTTQVIKADENGVFTYNVPWAGWWGFAALNTAKEKMDHQGSPKDVELGAVIWVEFTAPLKR